MSIVTNFLSKADFSILPQEVISDCILPNLHYREASIASRTNRILNDAFKSNEEFARQRKCIEGAVRDLETIVVKNIESFSIDGRSTVPFRILIIPDEQIEIRIPSVCLVHRDIVYEEQEVVFKITERWGTAPCDKNNIDWIDVKIKAIYKPTWDVRLFEGIHRNILRFTEFLCSFLSLLPLIALSPIFITSGLFYRAIKSFHSLKSSLEHFQVERIENVNSDWDDDDELSPHTDIDQSQRYRDSSPQVTEFIDLCLRKLENVLNSKK